MTTDEALAFLREQGYLTPVIVGQKWAAIMPLMFTDAIVAGSLETMDTTIEQRWCYQKGGYAVFELGKWFADGLKGEPEKWHRDPYTGRRRPDGDATKEYVDP